MIYILKRNKAVKPVQEMVTENRTHLLHVLKIRHQLQSTFVVVCRRSKKASERIHYWDLTMGTDRLTSAEEDRKGPG